MKSKKIILFISILCLCLVCIACSKQNNKENETESKDVATSEAETGDVTDKDTSGTNVETSETSLETSGTSVETSGTSVETSETIEGTIESTTEDTTENQSDETTTEEETNPVNEEVVMAKKLEKTFDKTITVASDGYTTTKSGLAYYAEGYKSVKGNRFVLGNGKLNIDFNNKVVGKYNKFILCYESTAPVKATVTYSSNGQIITDDFYLEKGAKTFSCLNSNYLEGKYASNLMSMTFISLNGECEFAIYELETVSHDVYSDIIYYLENNSYKIGINLVWGGGISYIEDKNCPDRYLKNLINQHDAGRLVQQSYYGTNGDNKYTPGDYNGTRWPYNPVQGGNLAADHSRIIDIVVEDYSIYIKSQPQDWGKANSITPSYMENVYTVYNDRIQVDNRFVDFAFYNNPYRDQELPAFYTVSYLNSFVYYDGSDSWTNDELSYKKGLPFWGTTNALERQQCLFPLRQSNTETWCAWVNQNIDYGIGLYIPNIDFFLAGCHAYDGSKDASKNSTNYVAPLNQLKIVSGEPIEYSYIITTGSVTDIRETFKEHKDFAQNQSLHNNYVSKRIPDKISSEFEYEFTGASSLHMIETTNNAKANFSTTYNAIKLTVNGADVQTVLKLDHLSSTPNADDYTRVTITYMIPKETSNSASFFEMFLCTGNTLLPEAGKSITGNYIRDGQFHDITVNLADLSFWRGNINHIRFDFFGNSNVGDVLYIRSIVFHN